MRRQPTTKCGAIACLTLLLLSSGVLHSLATAQMVKATLSRLVEGSRVIVLGHIRDETVRQSVASPGVVVFDVVEVFKGDARNSLNLCNHHPDSEWPDLSRLKGDHVIFASPDGPCFKLTLGYRSVTPVSNHVADTSGITGQPLRQPLDTFKSRLHALVLSQSQHSDH